MPLIFGDPESIMQRDRARLEGVDAMHAVHGVLRKSCRDCTFIHDEDKGVFRCEKYAASHPEHAGWPVVRWRLSWSACGAFVERL